MAKQSNYKALSIRMKPELYEQIKARADINSRSWNAEATVLIEHGIDASVQRDLDISSAAGRGQKSG